MIDKLNYIELVTIAIITVLIGLITEKILFLTNKKENIFTILKKSYIKFIFTLGLLGIIIHIIIKYYKFDQIYCEKKCSDEVCSIICNIKK